jgi:hypothetical protein
MEYECGNEGVALRVCGVRISVNSICRCKFRVSRKQRLVVSNTAMINDGYRNLGLKD